MSIAAEVERSIAAEGVISVDELLSALSMPSKPFVVVVVSVRVMVMFLVAGEHLNAFARIDHGQIRPERNHLIHELLNLEGNLVDEASEVGDDAVDLERAAEDFQLDRLGLLRDFLRRVLGVDSTESRSRLGFEPRVAVGQRRSSACR